MKGFTKFSNDVAFDTRLSMGARLTYAALEHCAWKAGSKEDDPKPVILPPLDAIADKVGCSRTALKAYIGELKKEGIVFSRRIGNRATAYLVYPGPCQSDSDWQERRRQAESAPLDGRNPTPTRARASKREESEEEKQEGDANASPDEHRSIERQDPVPAKAPRLQKVAGRNLPMDALADETGTDPAGGRIGELNAALNGRPGQPGIRDQFWRRCVSYAEQHPQELAELHELVEGGDRFERALANAVRRKAALYRARMLTGTPLTPSALRKWWTDLEKMPDRQPGEMTAAEIRQHAENAA